MKAFLLGLWLRVAPAKKIQPPPPPVVYPGPEVNDNRVFTVPGAGFFHTHHTQAVTDGLALREHILAIHRPRTFEN